MCSLPLNLVSNVEIDVKVCRAEVLKHELPQRGEHADQHCAPGSGKCKRTSKGHGEREPPRDSDGADAASHLPLPQLRLTPTHLSPFAAAIVPEQR